MSGEAPERARLDKWLWCARFYKTRGLAQEAVGKGRVWLNGARTTKAGHGVKLGDVLTFPRGERVLAIRIQALGERRGPAREAQGLYEVLDEKTP